MPTLATLLAAVLNIRSIFDAGIARLISMVGELIRWNATVIDKLVHAVYDPLDALLHLLIGDLTSSIQGDGTDPPSTLPAITTIVNNIYNGQEVDHDLLVHIGVQADYLKELVHRVSPAWYVAQWNSGYTHYGTPIEVSASGTYAIEASDGLLIEVLSVPNTLGREIAGDYIRYPHLGWILGSLPQYPDPAWTDLVYLGPQSQGFSWPGARDVVSVTVFLRPSSTIRITPWKNVLGD